MEEINEPITFSTFTSSVYGFSCDYPSKWIKTENNSFFVVGFRETEELPYPSFNVQILDLAMFGGDPEKVKIDDFQQMIMGQILRIGGKPSGFSDELINGGLYNGRSIIYYIPNDNMKSKQTFFFSGGFVYLISYTSKADEIFQEHLFVYDHAISSFSIFKPKGYKYFILSQNSISLDNPKNRSHSPDSLFLEYYFPKDWETDLDNHNLHTDQSSRNQYTSFTVSTSSINQGNSISLEVGEEIELNINYRDGLGNKLKVKGRQIDSVSESGRFEIRDVLFEWDEVIVKLRLTVPFGDGQYYMSLIFNRLISYLGIISHKVLRARSPIPYDIFDNLLIGYSLQIPTSFKLSSSKPTGEVISFKDTSKHASDISYCVRLVVEDISAAGIIKLNEYSNDVISKMLQQQPESQLLTQEPGFIRLDKHLASTVSIQSYDPELNQLAIQLVATSVQNNHGIVFSIRTKANNQFNYIYKKSFYMFDTFNYYNSPNKDN